MAKHITTLVAGTSGGDIPRETTGKAVWLHYHGFRSWFWLALHPPLTGTRAELRRQGLQRLEPEQLLCCLGQLAEVRQRTAGLDVEYWAPAESLIYATSYPVALGFLLPERLEQLLPQLRAPQVLSPYPQPNLGEIVTIQNGSHYQEYLIAECGAEAVAIQKRLCEALRLLQEDSGSEMNLYRLLAMLPQAAADYRARLLREQAALKRSWSDRVADLLAGQWTSDPVYTERAQRIARELHLLESEQRHLARLCEPSPEHERAAREQQWAEIRHLARDLAAAACKALRPASSFVSPTPAGVLPLLTLAPADWLKSQPTRGPILADPVSRALLRLWERDTWTLDPTSAQARAVFTLDPPIGSADLELVLQPDQNHGETWTDVLRWHEQLSDHLVDSWLAIQMLLLADNANDPTVFQALPPKLILETCERKKAHYGYPRWQRQRILQDLEILAHLQVCLRLPSNEQSSVPPVNPLLVVQQEGEPFYLALGGWIHLLPVQWQRSTAIPRRLLRLHPWDERYAKRLGLSLSFLFHSQLEVCLNVTTLNKELGIYPDPDHPKRARDTLMRAIKVLAGLPVLPKAQRQKYDEPMVWDWRGVHQAAATAPVIGAFNAEYVIEVAEVQRGFWDRWLSVEWHFYPPGRLLTGGS